MSRHPSSVCYQFSTTVSAWARLWIDASPVTKQKPPPHGGGHRRRGLRPLLPQSGPSYLQDWSLKRRRTSSHVPS